MIQIEPEEALLLSPFMSPRPGASHEAVKTFAIFEPLRTCIKKSIVAMLPPTIPVLTWGGGGAQRGAVVLTHTLYRSGAGHGTCPVHLLDHERRASTSTCSSGLCSMTSAAPQPSCAVAFTPGA